MDIGCLYLGRDMIVNVWLTVSKSGYVCECMGWLYLGQDRGIRIWAGCI
jgi:hypothetical protein